MNWLEALQLAGHVVEAKQAFSDFESKALLESSGKDNSNRKLVYYYADRAQQPAKALKVAQWEYAWRHDSFTLDAYAWALAANGEYEAANEQMQKALPCRNQRSEDSSHAEFISRHLNQARVAMFETR